MVSGSSLAFDACPKLTFFLVHQMHAADVRARGDVVLGEADPYLSVRQRCGVEH